MTGLHLTFRRPRLWPAAVLGALPSLCLGALLSACDEAPQQCPDCASLDAPPCQRFRCEPSTGTCEQEPVDDGTSCSDPESCSRGDRCSAGVCEPGELLDCDEPAPCVARTCDPETDRCTEQPTDEGAPCSTPCVAAGECASGACVGPETDCSWLDGPCATGGCHGETGECFLAPLPEGTSCEAEVPGCAAGQCDGAGQCVETPVAEGEGCDDGDRCTTSDRCVEGLCAGEAITECVGGDGCCPAGCPDDPDCCEVAGPVEDPGAWELSPDVAIDAETGVVMLTPALPNRLGQVWLAHDLTAPFVARFAFRAASLATPADGLIFMFYKDRDYVPGTGGVLGFMERERCDGRERTSGYGFEVDNYRNSSCEASANHFALVHESIFDELDLVRDDRTADGAWHDVEVTVEEAAISVALDGEPLLHWEGTIDRTFGGLGFGAATGGLFEEYVISDVELACL